MCALEMHIVETFEVSTTTSIENGATTPKTVIKTMLHGFGLGSLSPMALLTILLSTAKGA